MEIKQQRVVTVLNRMIEMAKEDPDYAEIFSDGLECLLDEIHGDDGFGTEGQSDPRGDFREGNWSMDNVEGLD